VGGRRGAQLKVEGAVGADGDACWYRRADGHVCGAGVEFLVRVSPFCSSSQSVAMLGDL
jgi:hypothetical protein